MSLRLPADNTDDAIHPHIIHVVIIHEKLARRKSDRYILNIALALKNNGYQVTIITTAYSRNDFFANISFADKFNMYFCGDWIPETIFGYGRDNLSTLKAIWMAFNIILRPPPPGPHLVILDVSPWALFCLKKFTNYKVFYLQNEEHTLQNAMPMLSLLESKWLTLADQILVETTCCANTMQKIFPLIQKQPIMLHPSVDIPFKVQQAMKITVILPGFSSDAILLLAMGKFRPYSNFNLVIDAFEFLVKNFKDKTVSKRLYLVIAGNCNYTEDKTYYSDLVSQTRKKSINSQISIMRHFPDIYTKTLLLRATVVIHPAMKDKYSHFLLKAMSLGKPIIGLNNGIAAQILVHKVSSLLIEADVGICANALKTLIMCPILQGFFGNMARNAFITHYSFDSMCVKLAVLVHNEFYKEEIQSKAITIEARNS